MAQASIRDRRVVRRRQEVGMRGTPHSPFGVADAQVGAIAAMAGGGVVRESFQLRGSVVG